MSRRSARIAAAQSSNRFVDCDTSDNDDEEEEYHQEKAPSKKRSRRRIIESSDDEEDSASSYDSLDDFVVDDNDKTALEPMPEHDDAGRPLEWRCRSAEERVEQQHRRTYADARDRLAKSMGIALDDDDDEESGEDRAANLTDSIDHQTIINLRNFLSGDDYASFYTHLNDTYLSSKQQFGPITNPMLPLIEVAAHHDQWSIHQLNVEDAREVNYGDQLADNDDDDGYDGDDEEKLELLERCFLCRGRKYVTFEVFSNVNKDVFLGYAGVQCALRYLTKRDVAAFVRRVVGDIRPGQRASSERVQTHARALQSLAQRYVNLEREISAIRARNR